MENARYRYLLLDLDDTLLDWLETERRALTQMMRACFGRELTDEEVGCYNRINALCWKMLERREIDKPQLKVKRFQDFLAELGIEADEERVREINDDYMNRMSGIVVEMPDAARVCRKLAAKYKLILITNGTDWVQRRRLSGVSFSDCFTGVVISDEVGCNKPAVGFFEGVKAITGDADPTHYLVIGDSQSSDIAFGRAIGADTLWVHLRDDGQTGEATYTVRTLAEVLTILA
ncbi:MAG: HAD-IA family hydrolase [Lachnospiraceae bacterium]|nr:HAD-IA family hydrolase [Lachnospiraceae bacterium]